jgi:formylglycine-generating enzyme required for sulfatase activity
MTDSLSLEQRQAQAAQMVRRFVRRFQPGYRALACHAALPLVLTPELVNYLRNECLRDQGVPWVAEVDLLLSDLCQPVGYELYALDTDVRAYLLAELERQYGQGRLQQVAKLLISYVRYLAETNPQANDKELEAQQWAAMVYLGAGQRQEAVRQIVAQLQGGAATVERLGEDLVGQAELARLAEIATEFAPQLADYPALVDYAALVREVMAGESVIAPDRLAQAYEVLPGQSLQLPEPLVREARRRQTLTATISSPVPDATTVARGVVWPELKTLEFQTGRWVEEAAQDKAASDWPPLHTETVEVVTLEFQDTAAEETAVPETDGTIPDVELVPFTFDVATLHRQGGGWQVRKQQQQAQRYIERLGNSVFLTLVALPGGSFVMGSPEDEQGRYDREGPQYDVQVPAFLMGRYPVTQEQWRAVAAMPMQSRELNPDPSRFQGDNRPVERVSWYDAVEFCNRLSAHTGRQYRLPSEAEWEYACRAGTTTPFHFGDTLSPEVANYSSSSAYANGPTGNSPGETTPVDRYGVANSFGLCDMHGNVREWCLDHYHSSYAGAPSDGSAWIDAEAEKDKSRIRRGGSWGSFPRNCRSAFRFNYLPRGSDLIIGFRVTCVAPRTLG